MSLTLADARVVTPDGVHDGWLTIEDGRITHVGRGSAPGPGRSLGGRYVVPGFVDIHNHGGAGGSFPAGDPEQAVRIAALHARHGTTTLMASLVTASPDHLARAASALADLCEDGLLAGIHFEGPYISKARCGAHNPSLLREPSPGELLGLLKAGRGHVRMLTIAAELPGALDTIREAVANDVIAALGHSDADYGQTLAGIDAGARVATHLYNAMPPLGHRDPGPVAALLQDERVTVELVNDGVHVHPAMLRLACRAAGPGRTALVTDAMAAAGAGDGTYDLGPLKVEVAGGVARLAGGGSIAGSTLTMDAAFRRAVRELGLSLPEAAQVTSLTPARVLGLDDRLGSVTAGKQADLVVLDGDLEVAGVMKHGSWITEP
ncbi:N-acetylglucosamine-6-phosphate deacetylase [Planomonospora parontospora]|uniref:N-acetylglucosamine-6-phosphate deacetylase n=1 Tax=Planomonospora parontospora TaxID=58119 RepID=UPI00166FD051|nr:N-acetylglucosamine-6-phosphate deacetylase [Planomonospora parontospora]GGL05874.1 N-acetylglucosamine-6-phosphate deacetylase [Planomonospora parontospora subsp. antibiotica]GII14261.1 N-acetylglucosamine-6-phosphate deacetylase [Planomonospora parontospora subsp. antibiotica]